MHLGKAIADAINSAGVKGYILNVEANNDEATITIERTIQDSEGKPALFMDEDGEIDSLATAVETFNLN